MQKSITYSLGGVARIVWKYKQRCKYPVENVQHLKKVCGGDKKSDPYLFLFSSVNALSIYKT